MDRQASLVARMVVDFPSWNQSQHVCHGESSGSFGDSHNFCCRAVESEV